MAMCPVLAGPALIAIYGASQHASLGAMRHGGDAASVAQALHERYSNQTDDIGGFCDKRYGKAMSVTARPQGLPDFEQPPLNEVVLGVQFMSPNSYSQILAGEVRALFRDKFPIVQEHSALAPTFEIFGPPQQHFFQLPLMSATTHDRFWFINEVGDELIQFQNDRLLHNWRQVSGKANSYPRFEHLIDGFAGELRSLNGYSQALSGSPLSINQAEVTYVNHLRFTEETPQISSLLGFLSVDTFGPDDFVVNLKRVIRDEAGVPYARLFVESASAIEFSGKRIISMSLTFRGTPTGTSVENSLEFLAKGRETIVNTFAELTSDSAHKLWKRVD